MLLLSYYPDNICFLDNMVDDACLSFSAPRNIPAGPGAGSSGPAHEGIPLSAARAGAAGLGIGGTRSSSSPWGPAGNCGPLRSDHCPAASTMTSGGPAGCGSILRRLGLQQPALRPHRNRRRHLRLAPSHREVAVADCRGWRQRQRRQPGCRGAG